MPRRLLSILLASALPLLAAPEAPDEIAKQVLAPLLDPVKVATLKGGRPANPRLYKVLFWLETASQRGGEVVDTAQTAAGYGGTPGANADKAAIIWSRTQLEDFGCFALTESIHS